MATGSAQVYSLLYVHMRIIFDFCLVLYDYLGVLQCYLGVVEELTRGRVQS